MSRWIIVTLPEDYKENNYQYIYSVFIMPIINKYGGTNNKCVCDGFTESEHKFKSLIIAKKCSKEINTLFKKLLKEIPFIFGNIKNKIIKPQSMVMPESYEKNGSRTIVRPDYSFDKSYKAKPCRNFNKELSKKYKDRNSPPFPANIYPGKIMKGNDNNLYKSIPNVKKIYSWKEI
jgi:hypothetical protein